MMGKCESTKEIYTNMKYSELISLINTTEIYAIDHSALHLLLFGP